MVMAGAPRCAVKARVAAPCAPQLIRVLNMEHLQLEGVIGASFAHGSTLHFLPGSRELVCPLGSSVVVQGGSSRGPPAFFTGHANQVSPSDRSEAQLDSWAPPRCSLTTGPRYLQVTCVAVSRSGRWLASGSLTHPGFKAPVLLHDLAARQQAPARELELHSVKVQSVGKRQGPGPAVFG